MTSYLKIAALGTLEFMIAFIIGTLLDIVFFKIYKKLDPNEKSNTVLISLVLLQLFTLILITSPSFNFNIFGPIDSFFLRLGLVTSQLFLLEFSMGRLSSMVYPRKFSSSLKDKSV